MSVALVTIAGLTIGIGYLSLRLREARRERQKAVDRALVFEKSKDEAYSFIEQLNKACDIWKKENSRLKAEATPPPFSAFTITPEWTTGDILNLRKFLASETGDKLMKRARAMEFANAVAGAQDQFHTIHSAGRTAGVTDTLKWIESCASDKMLHELSQATGGQVANQDTSDNEQDDVALLEKYSP